MRSKGITWAQTLCAEEDAKLKEQRCSRRGQYEPGTRRWRLDVTYRRVVSAACRRTASISTCRRPHEHATMATRCWTLAQPQCSLHNIIADHARKAHGEARRLIGRISGKTRWSRNNTQHVLHVTGTEASVCCVRPLMSERGTARRPRRQNIACNMSHGSNTHRL